MRWHYPFFDELSIDWPSKLRPALIAAAGARSGAELHDTLLFLLAELRDNHAQVKHLSRSSAGIVPLSWRRISDEIIVVGGTASALARVPVGSRIVEFDGIPAAEAYLSMDRRVSAATQGYRDSVTPFSMSLGQIGALKTFLVQPPTSGENETIALPYLDREIFDPVVREPRPATGAILADGIVYVDLEMLDQAGWAAVLPKVLEAKAVVFDVRGYITNTAFGIMGHFTDTRLWSPTWQTPIIVATGTSGYQNSRWAVMPAQPRIDAKAFFLVDGRSGSADETLAQIVRDNRLGVFVGEPTAGTNGNIASFDVPCGFSVRFTGMRAIGADGASIHGKGIVPEHVVKPTLSGIREGRDEVLEAAVAIAAGG
ncbi:MAG: hypothetical protein H0V89_07035 [Deltaproteobacteria bacterium]|nr:hypothetical protein [Deltaproteobacteria bacterium]